MTAGDAGPARTEKVEPIGAPTDPVRPTGRAATGPEPSRGGKDTKAFLYLAVLLGCIALGALALFFVFGFSFDN